MALYDDERGEPAETDDVPFEAIYDAAVRDLMEAKVELKNAKNFAKEAKEGYELAIKRLGELHKDGRRPAPGSGNWRWPAVAADACPFSSPD